MLLNLALVGLLFGASKKKLNPYVAAAILGLVKGGLYFVGSQSVVAALVACLVFGGMASGAVYFLARLDKREATEEPYPTYGTRKSDFKWEYAPVAIFVSLLLFGELVATIFIARGPAT